MSREEAKLLSACRNERFLRIPRLELQEPMVQLVDHRRLLLMDQAPTLFSEIDLFINASMHTDILLDNVCVYIHIYICCWVRK